MNDNRHPCAVCTRLIGTGFLMCVAHWRLVPQGQQHEVNGAWRRYSRLPKDTVAHHALRVRKTYLAASAAAIESARAAIGVQPLEGTLE